MRDVLITALAPILWGTTYIATTEFLPPELPLLAAIVRALPIGIAITLIYRIYPQDHWWWRVFVLGLFNFGLFFALLFVAAYRLPGDVVTTIGALQPLIVMFLAWLLLSEQPPALAIGASALGIIGVMLLIFDPTDHMDSAGVLAAIGAAISMATGIVLTKYWGNPVTLLPFTAWQLVAGGIILLPLALLFETLPPSLSARNIAGYLWLSLFNTGLAYGLWFRGIKRLRSFQISFLVLCSPVVAVVLGYIFLAQSFGIKQWLGIGLILMSITVPQMQRITKAEPSQPMTAIKSTC